MRIAELDEFFLEVNVFAGDGGRFKGQRDLLPLIGEHPRYQVLQPCQPILFASPSETYRDVEIEVTVVIRGKRDGVPNFVSRSEERREGNKSRRIYYRIQANY